MDKRIEFYKAAFAQRGAAFDIPAFRKTSRYKYDQGLGDVHRSIVRFIPTIAHKMDVPESRIRADYLDIEMDQASLGNLSKKDSCR